MKSTMSPESKALLAYLRQNGAATMGTLMNAVKNDTRTSLRKRLGNLERGGWLQKEIVQEVAVWSLRSAARDLFRTEKHRCAEPVAANFVGTPALPRRINVMQAAIYTPSRSPCTRQGALDFKHVPSHGVRC
jgi:hypothetical protein